MTTTTQINITAKDQTGQAFASANNNLTSLASSAAKTAAGLAGIGLSIAGAVESIKSISQATIQFQQFTNTLQVGTGSAKGAADALAFVRSESQRLGLDLATAADQYGKLTAAAKGTALEGKATRDIFSSIAQAATVMGLSADQTSGSLLAIQQIISKGTVSAEELRGQLGERLPGAFQIAARAIGVTTAELDKLLRSGSITAEQLLPALSAELNKTFGGQAEQAAQGLTAQMNRMNTAIFDLKIAIGESGLINFLSSGIELATKLASALTNAFGGGQKLSPIEKQVSLIKTLEEELESLQNLTNIPLIGDLLFDKKQADLLKFRIESATEDLAKMKASFAADSVTDTAITKTAAQADTLAVATKKTITESERFIAALKREAETAGLTTFEIKRLEAANLGVSASANPLIDRIERVTTEMDQQKEAARALADDLRKIASVTESVKTKEEKLIDTQQELNRLMKSGLSVEVYNRALKKAQDETYGITQVTRSVTDETSQLWMQAGRNIQSTLANSIFNFFDDGLKGMVKNVVAAVGRIASEFAALRIAQGIGLAGMFGASGGASAAGGGSLLDLASLGGNAVSLFKSGFGATSLIGGGLQAFGGNVGAFGGGLAGDAIGGLASGGFTSGAASAASLGSSISAIAGPAVALFAVDAIGRMLAGDKKLGGAEYIPVIGGFMAALFGRGPMKFRQQSLQGTASSEGFEGDISNVFRAKGGLFRSNGHKSVTEQLSLEMQTMFDQTINGFYASASSFAENLGLSSDLVDSFTAQVQIKSEKGKTLTEEAIAEMLDGIGNSLARNVLPIVDTLRKAGEDSFATLSRLNTEFVSLASAAQNLGASAEYAKELIKSMAFEQRTALVYMAGGVDNLSALTGFFFNNFLSGTEQFQLKSEQLSNALLDLGLSANLSAGEFKALVQNVNTSNDLRVALLQLAPAFLDVRNAAEQTAESSKKLAISALKSASEALENSVSKQKKDATERFNYSLQIVSDRITEVTGNIQKLTTLNDALKSTLNIINPISADNAREQIRAAIEASMNGDIINVDEINAALNKLAESDKAGFSNRNDFLRNKAENSSLVSTLQDAAEDQLSIEERSLNTLIDHKTQLEKGFNSEIQRLDALVTAAQQEIDIMEGLDTTIKTLAEAIGGFNRASIAAGGNPINASGLVGGNPKITSKDIVDFANNNSPMETYRKALSLGVTSEQIIASGKYTRAEIDQFVKDNKLASFDVGGIVPKTGLALVHKNEQILNSGQKDAITDALERLIVAVNSGARSSADVFKMLRDMSIDGTSLRTTAA